MNMHLKSWQQDLIIILFLLFPVFATWNVLFSEETFLGNDIIDGYLPWRFFLINEILVNHSLPLWNPYALCGTPFIGNIQASIFYPLTYIMLFKPFFTFKLLYIINHSIFGIGFYFLLRDFKIRRLISFIMAFAISTGGPFWSGSLVFFQTLVWMPFSILFFKKSLEGNTFFIPLTAIILTLQLFGGYPQFFWITILFCFLFLFRFLYAGNSLYYTLCSSFLIFLIFFLLSSVQLFPTTELVLMSQRHSGVTSLVETSLKERINPIFFLLIFFPGIFSQDFYKGDYLWGNISGILFLVSFLYILRPKNFFKLEYKYFLFFSILFSLFLSAGDANPLNKYIQALPFFSFFRHGSQYIAIGLISLLIILAQGFENFLHNIDKKSLKLLGAFFILFLIILIILMNSIPEPFLPFSKRAFIFTFAINLTAVFVVFLIAQRSAFRSLLILSFLLALNNFINLKRFSVPSDFYAQVKNKQFLFNQIKLYISEPSRIISTIVHPNESLLYKIQAVNGYDSLMAGRYIKFYMLASNYYGDTGNVTYLKNPDFRSKLADILNIKYILSPVELSHKKLVFITKVDGFFLYENKHSFPRAYFAPEWQILDDNEIVKNMLKDDIIRKHKVLFETKDAELIEKNLNTDNNPNVNINSTVSFIAYENEKVIISVNSPEDGFLVLDDTYYPGWKAYVNGKETKIFRANYFMRAVRVPAGKNEVTFIYDPWTYKVGKTLSIIGLILLIVIWINHKKLKEYLGGG